MYNFFFMPNADFISLKIKYQKQKIGIVPSEGNQIAKKYTTHSKCLNVFQNYELLTCFPYHFIKDLTHAQRREILLLLKLIITLHPQSNILGFGLKYDLKLEFHSTI